MKIIKILFLLSGIIFVNTALAQKVAVKTNLLYDATSTINLGVEFGLGDQTSFDLSANFNNWDLDKSSNKKIKNILFQPEFRYWTCERFNGHFFGIHAHTGLYNVSGDNFLLTPALAISTLHNNDLQNSRYEGWFLGAGISYGYHWLFASRWALEANIGFGYAYTDYDRFERPVCGRPTGKGSNHYFGPTKAGLTLIFLIK